MQPCQNVKVSRLFRDWYKYIYRTVVYQVIISVLKRWTGSVYGTSESFDTLTRLSAIEDCVECYGVPASGLNFRLSLCRPWRQIGVFSGCIHFLSVALHGSRSLFNDQADASIIQIYSVIKLYMFRASSLPIIRNFLLYIRHWWVSCRFVDHFQAESGWNSWWWAEMMPETCRVL